MTDWKRQWKAPAVLAAALAACYWLPIHNERFRRSVLEALYLARWYAREHVLLCLAPAFFIAGAIAVFVSQASVMRYLGPRAPKPLAYGVASVSGGILAVCSCTVLPLFAGIHRMGAGLGPATTFLYSGPAINVLAVVLTASVLGVELGIARAVGAVVFSVVIGLLMQFFFRGEQRDESGADLAMPAPDAGRPLWHSALFFAAMVGILVFANWGKPETDEGFWAAVHSIKWWLTGAFAVGLAAVAVGILKLAAWKVLAVAAPAAGLALIWPEYPEAAFAVGVIGLGIVAYTSGGEPTEWARSSWGFARQILPLLLIGVLVAGFLLGRPDHEGLIPSEWVGRAVGGNSLRANLVASFAGALMYFATLTEVPILQGLIDHGMGKGPALALLLAGPALSLPNMLVIRSVMGTRKTLVYVLLVVVMATASGLLYGLVPDTGT